MSQGKNVAIFGGTFDPIHLGHLLIAEQVYNNFSPDLDKIVFMPAGRPPHKVKKNLTSAGNRLKMLELAIENNEHFVASSYELDKEGKSYTAETLRYFLQNNIADKVFFIIGADSLLDVLNWREPDYLLDNAHFIVAHRPGYDISDYYQNERYKPYRERITILDTMQVDISSTRIREFVRMKKSIRYQTPDKVIDYIKKNNLYN
ncbi:MAG: nicotinate-nucleotide adenylyltransferase [Halanaerobiales bacterium]